MRKVAVLIYILSITIIGFTQPVNDGCMSAIDLSDGKWHDGDNTDGRLNCNTDHRTGHCGSPSGCTNGYEFTNSTNMCCGIEGIESSIWYTFTSPVQDTIYVDFRSILCDPVEFCPLGPASCQTTTLQGFLLLRTDSTDILACSRACWDTTKDCFFANDVNDINGQMTVVARAGRKYHIMIDTKKNSFTSCGSNCLGEPDCHANCAFQIRIRRDSSTLFLSEFDVLQTEKGVELNWSIAQNCENITIKRFYAQTKTKTEIYREECFVGQGSSGSYLDNDRLGEGVYKYLIYADGIKRGEKNIYVGAPERHIESFYDTKRNELNITLLNQETSVKVQLISSLGTLKLNRKLESADRKFKLNFQSLGPGVYYAIMESSNQIRKKKIVVL